MYIPIFHSNLTDMWEVAGLLFLSTETREKVQTGIEFFKASLPYVVSDSSQFIFFADKDFDYIDVLETVFVKCIVLLCSIHVLRYFNDKVLTREGYWGEPQGKNYLSTTDKSEIMKQISLVRDSPSEQLFRDRELKLLQMTNNLSVRSG